MDSLLRADLTSLSAPAGHLSKAVKPQLTECGGRRKEGEEGEEEASGT